MGTFSEEVMIDGVLSHDSLRKMRWLFEWEKHPLNPLIEAEEAGDWVADPAVLTPEESPDSIWHLFCCGKSAIKHYESSDGIYWIYIETLFSGHSPFVFTEDGTYYLFYHDRYQDGIAIFCRESKDLRTWSEPALVLAGEYTWEKDPQGKNCVRNPCIVKTPGGKYRLYYGAGSVLLKDEGCEEPAYVSFAEASHILGPYEKVGEVVLAPSKSDSWRNIGAGAMRVYYFEEVNMFVGFNSGVYVDNKGYSHSAVHVLVSEDGVNWLDSPLNPVLKPGYSQWERAFIHQLDVKKVGSEYWLYYNARDGWRDATERIGLAVTRL